jgi:glycosyltransferase involved in cell wall biosynthesis
MEVQKRLRILLVTHGFPPVLGGTEVLMAELAKELALLGHEVVVTTADHLNPRDAMHPFRARVLRDEMTPEGVRVIRFASARSLAGGFSVVRRVVKKLGIPLGLPSLLGQFPWMPGAWRYWMTERFDVAFTSCVPMLTATSLCLMRSAGLIRYPVILHTAMHPWGENQLHPDWTRRVLAGADHVLTNTHAEADWLRRDGLLPLGKPCDVMSPGLSVEAREPGDRRRGRELMGLADEVPVVLFLGRRSREKGYHRVLQAMRDVRNKLPGAELVVAGPAAGVFSSRGPDGTADLPSFIDIGQPGMRDKRDIMAAADVLCLPSVADSFGITYLEAMAQGLAIVALDLPTTREVLGEAAVYARVGPTEAPGLPEVLLHVLESSEVREHLSASGARRVADGYLWKTRAGLLACVATSRCDDVRTQRPS